MNKIHNPKIKERIKIKTKKQTIVVTIFSILTLLFLTWFLFLKFKEKPEPESMFEMVEKGSTREKVYISLDMINIPYSFAKRDDSSSKYYFVFDEENYIYIIRMSNSQYKKLSDESKKEDIKTIAGVSKLTEFNIRPLAVEAFNSWYPDNQISSIYFGEYFGFIYMDMTADYYNASIPMWLMILFGIGILCSLPILISNRNATKKTLTNYTQAEWDKIEAEFNVPTDVVNNDVIFTANYLIIFNQGMKVIKYEDIVWTYFIESRYNGIKTNRQVVIVTKFGKMVPVMSYAAWSKKRKNKTIGLVELIGSKNQNILVGFSSENRRQAVARYENKREISKK